MCSSYANYIGNQLESFDNHSFWKNNLLGINNLFNMWKIETIFEMKYRHSVLFGS